MPGILADTGKNLGQTGKIRGKHLIQTEKIVFQRIGVEEIQYLQISCIMIQKQMIDNSLDKIEAEAKKLQQRRNQMRLTFQEQSEKAQQLITLLLQLSKQERDRNSELSLQVTRLNNQMQRTSQQLQLKLKQLSAILAHLEKQNRDLKAQITKAKENEDQQSVKLSKFVQEYEQLAKVKEMIEKETGDKIDKYQLELIQQRRINDENVEKMIRRYEEVIEQKVKFIQTKYEQEINELRRKTKQKIEELEVKERLKENDKKQEVKKFSGDSERLLAENKRILSQLTQAKRKNLSLESELQASRQQIKLTKKQKQIVVNNLRKQIELLKSSRNETDNATNWWKEKVDNLNWESKQMQIEKEKQIRMIKEQSEMILDEIGQKYRQQKRELNQHIDRLEKESKVLAHSLELTRRQKEDLERALENIEKQFEQKQKKHKNEDDRNQTTQQIVRLKQINSQLRKQNVRKTAEIEVLKEQVKRLKSKVNKVTIAYQQNVKLQDIVQKQNKMLLSQIVFLRDKNKSNASKLYSNQKKETNNNYNGNSRKDSRILQLKSEQSEIFENDNEELAMYKQLIVEMEKDMNEAVAKLDEKNNIIQKQKGIIQRLERALNK